MRILIVVLAFQIISQSLPGNARALVTDPTLIQQYLAVVTTLIEKENRDGRPSEEVEKSIEEAVQDFSEHAEDNELTRQVVNYFHEVLNDRFPPRDIVSQCRRMAKNRRYWNAMRVSWGGACIAGWALCYSRMKSTLEKPVSKEDCFLLGEGLGIGMAILGASGGLIISSLERDRAVGIIEKTGIPYIKELLRWARKKREIYFANLYFADPQKTDPAMNPVSIPDLEAQEVSEEGKEGQEGKEGSTEEEGFFVFHEGYSVVDLEKAE